MKNENAGQEHGHHILQLVIQGTKHNWHEQYITGAQIRELGNIPKESEIFMAIEKPWSDERIMDDTRVDLARPGVEHFYTKTEPHLVEIRVNNVAYKVHRGDYPVGEIKSMGKVPLAYELEQLIDDKFTPLEDTGTVVIKGCEEFIGHVKDGCSS